MPIQIRITLCSEGENVDHRAYQRTLEIDRLTNTHIQRKVERRIDEINVYRAVLRHSPKGPVLHESEFRHRYGDDLLSIVYEAIESLGGVGGPDTGMRR